MKIALSGAHGIGKTTLAKELAPKLNLPLIPEFAREILDLSGFNWREMSRWQYWVFECALYETYAWAHSTLPSFISDRSLIDVVAYIECFKPGIQVLRERLLDRLWYDLARIDYDLIVFLHFPGYGDYRTEEEYKVAEKVHLWLKRFYGQHKFKVLDISYLTWTADDIYEKIKKEVGDV